MWRARRRSHNALRNPSRLCEPEKSGLPQGRVRQRDQRPILVLTSVLVGCIDSSICRPANRNGGGSSSTTSSTTCSTTSVLAWSRRSTSSETQHVSVRRYVAIDTDGSVGRARG